MTDYLILDGISVSFGENVALHPLQLTVRAGEFFCLLGPSGCGKSTTLNVVAGFLRVGGGQVLLDGRDITGLPPQRRQIGIVFQSYALFPHMTAADNIGYGLKQQKFRAPEIAAKVAKALALVRLDGKGHRYPRELSGGEQQRVAIARALAIEPRLLLLDEPLSNLDAKLREEMRIELKRIQRTTGVTTIFVTHDQEEALGAGDRIAVMNRGRVEQVGTPLEIYRRPASAFVAGFIGRSNQLRGSYDPAGRSISVDGHRLLVESPGPAGVSEALLFLRPEELQLEPRASQVNALPAKVLAASYAGATVDYIVATPLGEIEVKRLADDAPLAPGHECIVSWPGSSGVVLDGSAGPVRR